MSLFYRARNNTWDKRDVDNQNNDFNYLWNCDIQKWVI